MGPRRHTRARHDRRVRCAAVARAAPRPRPARSPARGTHGRRREGGRGRRRARPCRACPRPSPPPDRAARRDSARSRSRSVRRPQGWGRGRQAGALGEGDREGDGALGGLGQGREQGVHAIEADRRLGRDHDAPGAVRREERRHAIVGLGHGEGARLGVRHGSARRPRRHPSVGEEEHEQGGVPRRWRRGEVDQGEVASAAHVTPARKDAHRPTAVAPEAVVEVRRGGRQGAHTDGDVRLEAEGAVAAQHAARARVPRVMIVEVACRGDQVGEGGAEGEPAQVFRGRRCRIRSPRAPRACRRGPSPVARRRRRPHSHPRSRPGGRPRAASGPSPRGADASPTSSGSAALAPALRRALNRRAPTPSVP